MGFREKEALTYKSPAGVKVTVGDLVWVGDSLAYIEHIERSYGRWRAKIQLLNPSSPYSNGSYVRYLHEIDKSWHFRRYLPPEE
jgi:hypothetical protein